MIYQQTDLQGRKQNGVGTGGDGSKCLREWVGVDSSCVRTGGDETEIMSPCRSLADS